MGDIAVFRSYNWPDKAADIWRWSNEAIKTQEPVLPKILFWFSGETLCITYFISYAVYYILCVILLKEKKLMRAHFFIFGLHTESAWTHLGLFYIDSVWTKNPKSWPHRYHRNFAGKSRFCLYVYLYINNCP